MEHTDQTNTTEFLHKVSELEEKAKQLQEGQKKKDEQENTEPEKPKYSFDLLKLYFSEPYQIGDVTVLQPSLGQILEIGEKKFYSTLNIFIQNTTSVRLQLWDMGIDWNKFSNYELFQMFCPMIDPNVLHIILPSFDLYMVDEDGAKKVVLYDKEHEVEMTEELYEHLSAYIRTMFNNFPKEEFARGKATKEIIIEEERDKLEAFEKEKENSNSSSIFLPLVSSYLNHPGTKYKKAELKDVGIFEFMDSIARLQTYESATAMLKGAYSGFVDGSKLDKDQLNFMRDLTK